MKKEIIYICVLAFVMMLNACRKDGLEVYNDEAAKNSIYFPKADTINDLTVSFGYSKSDVKDSILKIVVRAIGSPHQTDRTYNLTIPDSSTLKPGIDYDFLNKSFTIKAGKVADTLKIKLYRNAAMAKDSLFLYLDLKPNENFTNDYLYRPVTSNNKVYLKYYTRLKLKVDDIAGPPPFWTAGNTYYTSTIGYLGTFSSLKFQLLISRYNLDVQELVQPNWFTVNGNGRRLGGWANGLKAYFTQMASAGTPIYEADGVTLMTMGKYAQ